jgi:hypothetical protein
MAPSKSDLFHIRFIREFLIRGDFWITLLWLIRFVMMTMVEFGAKFRSVLQVKSAVNFRRFFRYEENNLVDV